MLQEIQELKLRALILAHVPHVIREIRFGILLRVPDPAVDVFNEAHVAKRGEIAVNSRVLGMPLVTAPRVAEHQTSSCNTDVMNTCDRASCC